VVDRHYRHALNGSALEPGTLQLEVHDVGLRFGGVQALSGVSVSFRPLPVVPLLVRLCELPTVANAETDEERLRPFPLAER
jgi:hypothetical protein